MAQNRKSSDALVAGVSLVFEQKFVLSRTAFEVPEVSCSIRQQRKQQTLWYGWQFLSSVARVYLC